MSNPRIQLVHLLRYTEAILIHQQHLQYEYDINWLKVIVKMICVAGLSISFLISFFILEYYHRKNTTTKTDESKKDNFDDEDEDEDQV